MSIWSRHRPRAIGALRRSPVRVLVALTLGVLLGCSDDLGRRQDSPNIVLFVVDTLRADALGCYGNAVVETPAVDSMAGEGALFLNAYSQTSYTRASIASILTGLYPEAHRVVGDSVADPRLSLLSERLAARGYATAAIVTNPNIGVSFGFDQGFDVFDELYLRRGRTGRVGSRELITPSDEVVEHSLQWIAQAPRPFFAFVFTIDPHWPYDPPKRFDRYGGSYEGPFDEDGGRSNARALAPADRERVRSFYYGEVAFNDESFGRLLAGLRELGIDDDTVVVFTSDHGEEFWEHDGRWHGTNLYEEAIRVPLLMRYPPAIRPGLEIARPVETVGIMPTLLELAGAEIPEDVDGRSLLTAPDDAGGAVYASLELGEHRAKALLAPPWKAIWYPDRDRRMLYDLASDPDERIDLYRPGNALFEALFERLVARARASEAKGERLGAVSEARAEALPADARDALEELGYIEREQP